MEKIISKLNNESLLSDFPENTYQLCLLQKEDNKIRFSFNSTTNLLSYKNAAKYFNSRKYSRVILVCRSPHEPWTNEFPTKDNLTAFVRTLKCSYDIYYQEPWPSPVPNFNLSKNEVVVRFGFDEGLDINKWSIESLLDEKPIPGVENIMLHKSKIIKI